eukprot:12423728-Karenia_brevis.AAC.1
MALHEHTCIGSSGIRSSGSGSSHDLHTGGSGVRAGGGQGQGPGRSRQDDPTSAAGAAAAAAAVQPAAGAVDQQEPANNIDNAHEGRE